MSPSILVDVFHTDPLVSAGLATALRRQPDLEVREARPLAFPHHRRTVVVTDYASGLALLLEQREQAASPGPSPAVLVVTERHKEGEVRRALEAGVRGFLQLGCSFEELAAAVRALSAGARHIDAETARLMAESIAREPLTPREEEVMGLVVEGRGNKAIARTLAIGIGTVKSHLRSIYGKLDATTRTEAVTLAERRGLLEPAWFPLHRSPAGAPARLAHH